MADYSGALKKFRESGYPEDDSEDDEKSESSGVRTFKLTEEEAKELQPYQEKFGPGEEMVVEATGKLEGTTFRISSVKYAQGEEKEDASQVMGMPGSIPMS